MHQAVYLAEDLMEYPMVYYYRFNNVQPLSDVDTIHHLIIVADTLLYHLTRLISNTCVSPTANNATQELMPIQVLPLCVRVDAAACRFSFYGETS